MTSASNSLRKPTAALLSGPLLFAAVLVLPIPGVDGEAHRLVAIYAWAVAYWVLQPVPAAVTAVLSSALAVLLAIAPAETVFAAYGDPIILLFVGSFILAQAMQVSGLDRRLSLAVLRLDWATRSGGRLLLAVGLVTAVVSLWVSNTATTAIMLPVGRGILASLGATDDRSRRQYAIGFMLMLTWSSSVAVGLPVASPPNLIAIGMLENLADVRITFFEWVLVTMPLTFAMLALAWLLLRWRYAATTWTADGVRSYVRGAAREVGPWTPAQRNVAAVFALVALLWFLPGVVSAVAGQEAASTAWFERHLPESAVALLGAVLLFVLPTSLRRGAFTISWEDAARIDWGTILLFGGGLALGRLSFETGLAAALGDGIVGLAGADDVWALTAAAIVLGVLLSELSSNTASASTVIPVIIAIAAAGDISPVPPVLGAALGASFGFMLPISTPPNALVYGSGLVPLREMIRSGFWLDLSGAVLIWVGLRVLCPLVGVM